jgi:hypothetical protein
LFFGRNFQNRKMASIDARDEEAKWEAEWEAASEAASAEWTGTFARAAAGTERGMAEAVAANERLMAEAAQAQAPDTEWEAKRAHMAEHHARHGCLLAWFESTVWVRTQRADYAAGTMSEERKALLLALPFWKWKPEFEVYLNDLAEHHNLKKHGRMPPPKGSDTRMGASGSRSSRSTTRVGCPRRTSRRWRRSAVRSRRPSWRGGSELG